MKKHQRELSSPCIKDDQKGTENVYPLLGEEIVYEVIENYMFQLWNQWFCKTGMCTNLIKFAAAPKTFLWLKVDLLLCLPLHFLHECTTRVSYREAFICFFMMCLISCIFYYRMQGSEQQQPNDGPPSRPGSQMEQGMTSSTSGTIQNKSKTTSAPTSPLKEKKSSFFGKVYKAFTTVFHHYIENVFCRPPTFPLWCHKKLNRQRNPLEISGFRV